MKKIRRVRKEVDNRKGDDWTQKEQDAFDDYMPYFISAIKTGYMDDYLQMLTSACDLREKELSDPWPEPEPYVPKPKPVNRTPPKKRMHPAMVRKRMEEERAASEGWQTEELADGAIMITTNDPAEATRVAQIFGVPDAMVSAAPAPAAQVETFNGMAVDKDGCIRTHGFDVFVRKIRHYTRRHNGMFKMTSSNGEDLYFSKKRLEGLHVLLSPDAGLNYMMIGEVFEVTKVNNLTVEGKVKTVPSGYQFRANSPIWKSYREGAIITLPIGVLRNNLDLP